MALRKLGSDLLPHLVSVLAFLLVAVAYHSPVIFDNREVSQHDMLQWEGTAHKLLEHQEDTGETGLWAANVFSGMPAYLIYTKYGWDLPNTLRQILELGLPRPAGQTFLALLGFYLLLLAFGVRPWVALAGAVAFGLNSFNLISIMAGHNGKGYAMAYMAWVLAGMHWVFRKKYLGGAALAGIGLVLSLRTAHMQIVYYLLLLVVIYGLSQLVFAIRDKELPHFGKSVGLLTAMALLALMSVFGRLWSVYEYGKYSTRGDSDLTDATLGTSDEGQAGLNREYAFQWSQGADENMTLLIPYFRGGSSNEAVDPDSKTARQVTRAGYNAADLHLPAYWGDQVGTGGPIYAGAIVCFLFVLGLVFAPARLRWWLLAVFLLGFVLSLGKSMPGLNFWLFDHLPGYNKFRTPSMAVVLMLFAMPLLGCIGLEHLLRKEGPRFPKGLWIALGSVLGLLLIVLLMLGTFSFAGPSDLRMPEDFLPILKTFRRSLLVGDLWRSVGLIVLAAGLVVLIRAKVLKVAYALPILALLITIDLWGVGKRYLNDEHYVRNPARSFFRQTEADKAIHEAAADEHYRVLNLQNPWNEARTSYHHPSIGGYHGAKMKRYQELITYQLSPEIETLISRLQAGVMDFGRLEGLNMLNTSFVTFGPAADNVVPNAQAMGAAWVVNQLQLVPNADAELAALDSIDVAKTAVVDASKTDLDPKAFAGTGKITLKQQSPNQLVYTASVEGGEAFGVFSEIYYPAGWTATVNGRAEEIVPCNYVLRGLPLPAGQSEVVFTFAPTSYVQGKAIGTVGSILLLLAILGGLGWSATQSLLTEEKPEA